MYFAILSKRGRIAQIFLPPCATQSTRPGVALVKPNYIRQQSSRRVHMGNRQIIESAPIQQGLQDARPTSPARSLCTRQCSDVYFNIVSWSGCRCGVKSPTSLFSAPTRAAEVMSQLGCSQLLCRYRQGKMARSPRLAQAGRHLRRQSNQPQMTTKTLALACQLGRRHGDQLTVLS